jgi:hypothetical protein
VASALQRPDVFIRPRLDQLGCARIPTEEVLANERPIFSLERLEITVKSVVHQVDQGAITISCE